MEIGRDTGGGRGATARDGTLAISAEALVYSFGDNTITERTVTS